MKHILRSQLGRISSSIIIAMCLIVLWGGQVIAYEIDVCNAPGLCPKADGVPTDGWDGPGLGSYTLNYYIGSSTLPNNGLPTGLSLAVVETELQAAMLTWSSIVQVSFNKIGDYTDGGTNQFQPNSVDVYWASGVHNDGNPFDGAWNPGAATGNVLGHSWGPPDISGGPVIAGNMHYDADETWVTSGATIGLHSATIDLETVLLHELGHVLGLGHENDLGSGLSAPVMQSFYWGELRTFHSDDIAGIKTLYAAVGEPPDQIPEPGTLLLLGSGLVGLAIRRMIKKKVVS